MTAIKLYTDLEQSKKLAEILPNESADMAWYPSYAKNGYSIRMLNDSYPLDIIGGEHDEIPAWSLAALLDVIPGGQVNRMAYSDKYEASSWNNSDFEPAYYVEGCDNAIDACYELILKLHKNNIL